MVGARGRGDVGGRNRHGGAGEGRRTRVRRGGSVHRYGGEGHTYPGATVPFGMVQLSPDTRIQPREKAYGWAAGYRHDDTSIVGFSHTHFPAAAIPIWAMCC